MASYLGLTILFLLFLNVQAEELKTSDWKIDTSNTKIFFKTLFILQRASSSFCAGYCDKTPRCNSFSIDKTSRICHGYSSEITTSPIYLYNMDYYQLQTSFIYEFEHHTFTNCGKSGRTGPTLSSCQLSYYTKWSLNTDNFNVVNGLQEWLVPRTGHYLIQAFGAAGGLGDTGGQNLPGGKGAEISGTFFLSKGTMLRIICGQKGTNGPGDEAGGGGGGSFVFTGTTGGSGLLIAAAGGGGGGEENTRAGFNGQAGEQGFNHAGFAGSSYVGNGGVGYGGVAGTSESAGAGWKSDGWTTDPTKCSGGQRWYGGIGNKGGNGGFGGGGSGCNTRGGGGGGGFTGAAGLDGTNNPNRGGGGGGSYNGGTNQVKITGSNLGHGFVYIEFVSE